MRLYKVVPYNSLWFGGLTHMTAGEDHYLRSINLPSIKVFFPFVKKEVNENGNSRREGACYGVALCDDKKNIFLPLPADVVGKRKRGGSWRILKFIKEEELPLIRGTLDAFESMEGYFITKEGFEKWKKDCLCDSDIKKWDAFATTELKVGLQLNKDTKTAEERMLYFQERVRLREGYYIAFFAKECVNCEGFIGGERNPARIEELKDVELPFGGKLKIEKDSYYRLYLLTHAYIKDLRKGEVLKLKEVNGGTEIDFEVIWVYSKGSEFVSGHDKPAVEMLRPATVILLRAKDSAELEDLVQIDRVPETDKISNFLESGWNTGILAEGGVES